MPEPTEARRFVFHGNAMPFGGRILKIGERVVSDLIEGPPTAALTVAGGQIKAPGRGSSHRDAFRWGETEADAKGELGPDGSTITTVTSSVADLYARNNPHVFEADLIRTTMVSVHPKKGEPSMKATEIIFGTPGKGMTLDGDRIEVEYEDDLSECPTFKDFTTAYKKKRNFFDKHKMNLFRKTGKPRFGEALPRGDDNHVLTSIVRSIRWRGETIPGHRLYLEGFGSLYFGEILMNESHRRLTMVRLAMGSEMQAESAAGEADLNGEWTN